MCVCVCVCVCVCSSISGHCARTVGPIGTGVSFILPSCVVQHRIILKELYRCTNLHVACSKYLEVRLPTCTDGRAETPERHGAGRGSAGGTWHVARAAALRSTKNFLAPLEVKWGESLNPNSQVTRVLYQLKIRWGCRSSGVPAARARGEEAILTWVPRVKGNFELATSNSVHGCTWARPTWRRMKKGARVHGARAVHVQVF